MRDYGKVFSRIWESADFRAMTEDGRALALYLLTCPHGTSAGVFRMPDGYACEDLQWTVERVAQGFRNLAANGFATRCEATKWVWIHKYLEWNPPENPNQLKGVRKVVNGVPDKCAWRPAFTQVCGAVFGMDQPPEQPPWQPPDSNLCATLAQPFVNQDQEQEKNTNTPPTPRQAGGADPPGFADFWRRWPSHPRKAARDQCRRKWAAKGCEGQAARIVTALEAAKASAAWRKDGGEFIPAPLVWLNQSRWEAPTHAITAPQDDIWAGAA